MVGTYYYGCSVADYSHECSALAVDYKLTSTIRSAASCEIAGEAIILSVVILCCLIAFFKKL